MGTLCAEDYIGLAGLAAAFIMGCAAESGKRIVGLLWGAGMIGRGGDDTRTDTISLGTQDYTQSVPCLLYTSPSPRD